MAHRLLTDSKNNKNNDNKLIMEELKFTWKLGIKSGKKLIEVEKSWLKWKKVNWSEKKLIEVEKS